MPYKFPNVSFDWLGELPGINEEARALQHRKETLADLDLSNPDAIEKKAAELAKSGSLKDMEMALRLQASAREKRAQTHKISEDLQYRQNIPLMLKALEGGGGGAAAPPPQEDYNWPAPGTQNLPGPQGAVQDGGPPQLGPMGQGPMAQGPGAIPGPTAQSPSEEILARAEGTTPVVPVPGPQYAQAGGPQAPQAPPPGPAVPPWLQGAQAPVVTRPPPRPQILPAGGEQDAARAEAQRLRSALMMAPPKTPVGILQALMAQYRNALGKTDLTPDQRNYEFESTQRERMGERRETFEQWNADKQTLKGNQDEVQSFYKEYRNDAATSRKSLDILNRMDQIIEHPSFVSGRGAALYGSAVNGLNTLAQIARQYNIPVPDDLGAKYAGVGDPVKTAALQEEYVALANKVVFATLGTLGNQISEGDRKFIERANASLSGTPQGNKALHKFMRQIAERSGEPEKWAREYRHKVGSRATAIGMEQYVADKRESSSLFADKNGEATTPAGRELETAMQKYGPAKPPPAGPPAGPPRQRVPADTIIYQGTKPYRMGPDGVPVPVEE